ncbi:MAG: extracellular solute-binding protein [Kiloniellaceae bacterium]
MARRRRALEVMRTFPFVLVAFSLLLLSGAWAEETPPAPGRVRVTHAIAMHGEPKYGPDFKYFDFVNPDAPKGGTLRQAAQGTFDSFNGYIAKGTAAAGLGFLVESLMTSGADEAFTEYGLIAETIEWPEDRSWVAFTLRPEARWHDGQPITVDDVIFSLETMKTKGHPFYRFYYQSVVKAERVGPRKVKFTFAEGDNRELPLIVGQLPILPRHYWEGRDFEKTTLEPPLGSGPYRIADFEPGRHVTYQRVEDYWGRDLPVNRGVYNFDRIRIDYYRDDTVIRQALKAGDIDVRVENQAKAWALDYNVPVVEKGWLVLQKFPHERPTGMQAFVMNTRRAVFADRRVRRALAFAFDFEWTNKNLFFNQYTRTESYFSNSELAATGLPGPQELEILAPYRGRVPKEVFTQAYWAPKTDGSGWPRENLARAFALLADAGWVVRDLRLVNAETGAPMSFEILLVSPAFERIVLPFVRNLKRLGIDARVRLVDAAQYQNRLRSFDFDMLVASWGQSDSPGNEQRNFWSSAAADTAGSRNLAGIKDPVVDELIELVIAAPDREALIVRTRALDRVLLWGHYVVPNWHIRFDRIAYWDKFGRPKVTPKNGTSLNYWWIDPAKERALAERRGREPEVAERAGDGGTGTALVYLAVGLLLFFGYFTLRRMTRKTAG